jgi:hypothetical protein
LRVAINIDFEGVVQALMLNKNIGCLFIMTK